MAIIIFILICIVIGLIFADKTKEFNIEHIIHHGILEREEHLKGEIFYRGTATDNEKNLSYYTYIRLTNGSDMTVNNKELFNFFNTGDNLNIIKKVHKHKMHRLTFYLIELSESKYIRICEELDTID